MSDAINHYMCGFEVLLEIQGKLDGFHLMEDVFYLGSQGPDMFFYFNVLEKEENRINYGSLIHTQHINEFFTNSFDYLNNLESSYKRDVLYSYLCGFVTHHTLDVMTHPFIIYRTGKYLKSDPVSEKYKNLHKKYEILLDIAFFKNRYNKKAYQFKLGELFEIAETKIDILEKYYSKVIESTFGLEVQEGTIKKSIEKSRKLTGAVSDPSGLKRFTTGIYEIFTKRFGDYSSAFYPVSAGDDINVLNLDHQVWKHPCDDTLQFTDSYPDLFDKAVYESIIKISALTDLLSVKNINGHLIEEFFKDMNFETGLNWRDERPIKYFDVLELLL
ncbi:MAG: zinc dependent phospholipase C family protein [Eubacteriaceae bacterium]|nr:zinc dependent phospholipase C family protein [Eubacteriaceae bacterium]